jgi:hypothetical protein
VQRALELGADALLVAKHGVDGVYDSDPRVNPAATHPAAQQPSYGAQGEVPASAYSLANAASCTLTGAVCAPPG